MDDVTAIATAHRRIGKRARTSTVMVYATLLMLLDERAPPTRIALRAIEDHSVYGRDTVRQALRELEQLRAIAITRDLERSQASTFQHTYVAPRAEPRS